MSSWPARARGRRANFSEYTPGQPEAELPTPSSTSSQRPSRKRPHPDGEPSRIAHTVFLVGPKTTRPRQFHSWAKPSSIAATRLTPPAASALSSPSAIDDDLDTRNEAAGPSDFDAPFVFDDDNDPQWDDPLLPPPPASSHSRPPPNGPPRKRARPARRNPLVDLKQIIGLIGDCTVRHEGLGDAEVDSKTGLPACSACSAPDASSRCRTCLHGRLLCNACLLKEHEKLPLHHVDCWNGQYWVPSSLAKLGLRVRLGHNGKKCPNARSSDKFVVIDVSGIHVVSIDFCGCSDREISVKQLLAVKWWPSTANAPTTAMTDEACRLYHAQTLQGKVNAYDFWNGLLRITDSSGLRVAPPRYSQMLRIVKIFRYHRVLKRGGIGHASRDIILQSTGEILIDHAKADVISSAAREIATEFSVSPGDLNKSAPEPVTFAAVYLKLLADVCEQQSTTPSSKKMSESYAMPSVLPGSLAVRCPACPNKGNMAPGWRNAPRRDRYKHALYISEDANFKLRRKARASVNDTPMGDGGLFFTETSRYEQHLKTHRNDREMKECRSSHTAISASNNKGDTRYEINGVGALLCARHLVYFPCAVADLRFGERYVSMDYILFVMLELFYMHIMTLYITYDIACQFSKHIVSRWDKYGTGFQLDAPDRQVRFAIPKFHIPAHGENCNEEYNLNYTQGAGRTCGEGIEAGWANTNGAALMTREAGPYSRHFMLDDLFQSINWQKVVGLGSWMTKNLQTAVKQHNIQIKALQDLESSFPPTTIANWLRALRAWENDFGESPNPFHEEHEGNEAANVRLEIDAEEAEEQKRGEVQLNGKTQSMFLAEGIDVYDMRWTLHRYIAELGNNPAPSALKVVQQKRNAYRHKLASLRALQRIYTPPLFEPTVCHTIPTDPALAPGLPTLSSILAPGIFSAAAAVVSLSHLSDKIDVKTPEVHELAMPWDLDERIRDLSCSSVLVSKAVRLHIGECRTSLHSIRRALRARYAYIQKKRVHVDGAGVGTQSGAVTKARNNIARVSDKIKRLTEKYGRSRTALFALDAANRHAWQNELLELKDEDLRLPTKDEKELGQGFRHVSWLWTRTKPDATDIPGNVDPKESSLSVEEVHESMRVEWCTNRARTDRWFEETQLLLAEMRRVLVSLLNTAQDWEDKQDVRPLAALGVRRGLSAYAARQAAVYKGLARQFYGLWRPVLSDLKLTIDWPVEVLAFSDVPDVGLVDFVAIRSATDTGRKDLTDDIVQIISEDQDDLPLSTERICADEGASDWDDEEDMSEGRLVRAPDSDLDDD